MTKKILQFTVFLTLLIALGGCSKYEPSPNMTTLKAGFVDSKWNGNKVPSDEVCGNYNKRAGNTPAIKISNLPKNTNKIVLSFSDLTFQAMNNGGHGVISYKVKNENSTIVIPSIKGETFELPENFTSISSHKATKYGKTPGAYLAPCSGGKGNTYMVLIEAIHEYEGDRKPMLLGETTLRLGRF